MERQGVKSLPCLPEDKDEPLLKAALGPPQEAKEAWQQWRQHHPGGSQHYTHHRLLPLVSRRLGKEGLCEADRLFLRGLHRYHWTRNQLLSRCATTILQRLQECGIDTLILKGLATAHLIYRDLGVRPMYDFDVLVRPQQRDLAVAVLQQAGWVCSGPLPEVTADHGCEFRNPQDQRFDLHWFATDESRWSGADDDLWHAARPFQLGRLETLALSPTHQLMHTLIHGVKVTGASPCVWVADACAILDSDASIDWVALLASVRERRVVLTLHLGLEYLHQRMGRPVPLSVLEALARTPVNWSDRIYYQTKVRCGSGLIGLARPYLDYLRTERPGGMGRPGGFLVYLMSRWQLTRLRQIPARILAGVSKRLRRAPS